MCGEDAADPAPLPPKHRNIILIGMPAVGKTTIGKRIAAAADLTFLDTDRIIETETGKKIPDLIREHGTDGFLAIENRICSALEAENCIIATGGSVVYGEDAMRHLSENGTVVYLKLAFPLLQKRLRTPRERGVVLRRGQSLYDLYRERVPLYEKYADIVIDEHNCYPTQTAERVYRALRRFGFFRERKNPGYLPRTLFSKKSEEQKNAAKIQDK
jgi:shikimate kinase